jgi:CRP-like cAMP-binding protein
MGLPEWLFENKPTKYTFEAILECELLIFNMVDLENLAKKNPAIFDLYIWSIKEMMAMMIYRIETMIHLSPEERYMDLLEKYPLLFQTVFNKHIANFLGITPVSLSRIIKRMKDNPQK